MRHRKDGQILSTFWHTLQASREPNNAFFFFDLKIHTSLPPYHQHWTACHPGTWKQIFLFHHSRQNITSSKIERYGFWNENYLSGRWSCMLPLINANWFSFRRKRNDSDATSWFILFQPLRSLCETEETDIHHTVQMIMVMEPGYIWKTPEGPLKKAEQRICGYQMKALGRQPEWHKHVVKDEQHLVQWNLSSDLLVHMQKHYLLYNLGPNSHVSPGLMASLEHYICYFCNLFQIYFSCFSFAKPVPQQFVIAHLAQNKLFLKV